MTEDVIERIARSWWQVCVGHYREDTAAAGCWDAWTSHTSGAGHCAVVTAVICCAIPRARPVSAKVNGVSHWFVRLDGWDIDITGRQFQAPDVAWSSAGCLWPDTRERSLDEINSETWRRALVFLCRVSDRIRG